MDIDGTPHESFDLTSPDELAALIIASIYLFFTLIVIGMVVTDVVKDPIKNITSRNLLAAQICFLVWQILLNSPLCNPAIVWATNVLGTIVLMLVNIAQWKEFGSAGFALLVIAFETWNAYFLVQKLHQFQGMKVFQGKSISNEAHKASRNLTLLVIFDIIMIWFGFFLYVASLFLPLNGLVVIGATIGVSHCLTITFVFKLVKVINSKVKKSMEVEVAGTTATNMSGTAGTETS
ncbi:hypothetical protein HDV04_004698 [Boothiomyces sp. JEL0838]|nr:hypothetical protein HDV04_004698 [Boothiomyces sp. JEL0838]